MTTASTSAPRSWKPLCADLKYQLMEPDIFKEFASAFIAERNTIIA